jgi:phage-related protein
MDIQHNSFDFSSVRPTFGATATFSANIKYLDHSDGYSQTLSQGLNFINMSYGLNLQNLTDEESQNVVSFLQSQFYYEPQQYDGDGSFSNKRVDPFEFQPNFPYKKLNFNCLSFNHSKPQYNINNISAQLTCVAPSILDSVESSVDYNSNIDSLININSTLSPSDQNQNINITNGNSNSYTLQEGNYIYASGDYRNAEITSVSPMQVNAPVGMPASTVKSQHNNYRNSIFIDSPNDCSLYPHKPIHDNTELDLKFFDFRPTLGIEIAHAPKFKQSSAHDIYKKTNKYGYNPNLKKFSFTFDKRSGEEAKSILLFLESHLGYRKFAFHLQKDYNNKNHDSRSTTPHRSDLSFFYCPEWSHTFVYHENHTVAATFIECPRP